MLRPTHRILLDHMEQLRSAEYRFDLDRSRFELGAALLRLAVGRTMGWRAAAIRVDRTCDRCSKPHGRPRVLGFDGHVSVSHSGNVVAVAISSAGPVGIDVETIEGRAELEHCDIADLVLTASERSSVDSRTAFLRVWTRKEAVLKATGYGLRVPMTEVIVSSPYREPNLISLRGNRKVPGDARFFIYQKILLLRNRFIQRRWNPRTLDNLKPVFSKRTKWRTARFPICIHRSAADRSVVDRESKRERRYRPGAQQSNCARLR
jgi:4'-phosphopantetheinyl transferase